MLVVGWNTTRLRQFMVFFYWLYGFRLQSDLALPELLPADPSEQVDITFVQDPTVTKAALGQQVDHYTWVNPTEVHLVLPEVAHFLMQGGSTLRYAPDPGVDEASLRIFMLGSGIGALLMQRGFVVMHGNAIDMGDGGCLMCVGDSGVGKSTTATAMMQRGYRVISDDVCPMDPQGRVVPGMPRMKLWHETAEALDIPTQGLDRVRPEVKKYNIPLGAEFSPDPLPIRAVFELSPQDQSGVEITPLTRLEKLHAIGANTYRNHYLHALGQLPAHFQTSASLFSNVPFYRITRPKDGFEIEPLLDRLCETYQSQTPLADVERTAS